MIDRFQERYLEHQKRKANNFDKDPDGAKIFYNDKRIIEMIEIMENRRSQRNFNDKKIEDGKIALIKESVLLAPSSCNRQAIYLREIDSYNFENLVVGGTKWSLNADKIYLILADKEAYKSPNEKGFMPYLDAGFVAQNIYLMSEVVGIGCCFVNPNIREVDKIEFNNKYNKSGDYFCGAVVLGNYDNKATIPPKRSVEYVLRK